MKELLFIDTETTDLEKPGIVQLGISKRNAETISEYFKNSKPIAFEAMAVHHITEDMVKDCPEFIGSETQLNLAELVANFILVAHNAAFDMEVLKENCVPPVDYICTLKVAKYLFQKEPSYTNFKLQYLRYRMGCTVVGTNAHDAAADVDVLKAVFEKLVEHVKYIKPEISEEKIIETFLTVTKKPLLLHIMEFGKHRGKTWEQAVREDRQYFTGYIINSPDLMKDPDISYSVNHYLNPPQK